MHFYTITYSKNNKWQKYDDLFHLGSDLSVVLKDENGLNYGFKLVPGFVTDGGSVPFAFRWFVPCWSKANSLVNIAYALHDALYASELLPRAVADDILRGMLRDAGFSRLRASTVCFCVNQFAANHYGRKYDRFGVAKFLKMRTWKE